MHQVDAVLQRCGRPDGTMLQQMLYFCSCDTAKFDNKRLDAELLQNYSLNPMPCARQPVLSKLSTSCSVLITNKRGKPLRRGELRVITISLPFPTPLASLPLRPPRASDPSGITRPTPTSAVGVAVVAAYQSVNTNPRNAPNLPHSHNSLYPPPPPHPRCHHLFTSQVLSPKSALLSRG